MFKFIGRIYRAIRNEFRAKAQYQYFIQYNLCGDYWSIHQRSYPNAKWELCGTARSEEKAYEAVEKLKGYRIIIDDKNVFGHVV